jgi:hypothetical protein
MALDSAQGHETSLLAGQQLQSQDIFRQIVLFIRHRYNGVVRSYLVLNKQVEPVRVEANVLVDSKGELAQRYGNSPALYLVRPDGYVVFQSPAARVHLLRAYLAKLSTRGAPGAD